jgi:hypothetical protein
MSHFSVNQLPEQKLATLTDVAAKAGYTPNRVFTALTRWGYDAVDASGRSILAETKRVFGNPDSFAHFVRTLTCEAA